MAQTERVEVQLPVGQLRVGMYVCRLDRPWLETTFGLQGFTIETEDQILELCRQCVHVFIDERRKITETRLGVRQMQLDRMVKPEALARLERIGFRFMRGPDRPILIPVDYPQPMRMPMELARARNAWRAVRVVVNQCIARAKAGKALPIGEIDNVVPPIIESVVRGADASMWLAAQRRNEPYPVAHPLNCCALVLMYSRFLGFPPEVLLSLAKASLLFDIGMWRLDQNYYINRAKVDEEGRNNIDEHVLAGLEYLQKSEFVDIDAILAITHHHERLDGCGYPRRIRGDKVSLMGFMLQIADTFDALCSKRSYDADRTIQEAQRVLYAERGTAFPDEVLEQFFQALGVHPTGSLVELSDGSIAAVSGQASASRLYPWLIPAIRPDGSRVTEFEEVWAGDLIKREVPIRIVRSLPANHMGVRLEAVEPQALAA